MQLNTVIFDMDGLLIDSEPLWHKAAVIVFAEYQIHLTEAQYNTTTGLRTREFIDYWFGYFGVDKELLPEAEEKLLNCVIELVDKEGQLMIGLQHIFQFFIQRNFKIGLATSSPQSLIEVVVKKAGIGNYLQAVASAEDLAYGKPHPEVYLACAQMLNSHPLECVCFEDSFNGMLAAKSARMKCVVVPAPQQLKEEKWAAADLKLSSLQNFGELHFQMLQNK